MGLLLLPDMGVAKLLPLLESVAKRPINAAETGQYIRGESPMVSVVSLTSLTYLLYFRYKGRNDASTCFGENTLSVR